MGASGFRWTPRRSHTAYILLADLVVVLHFLFILFVLLGGLLALRWRRVVWLHVPAAVWGVLVEFAGWICPLTPLENALRRLGGATASDGSFIERYLIPVMYPEDLTRPVQIAMGMAALAVNAVVYMWIWRTRNRHSAAGGGGGGAGKR